MKKLLVIALIPVYAMNAMETKVVSGQAETAQTARPERVVEYFKVEYRRVPWADRDSSGQPYDKYGSDGRWQADFDYNRENNVYVKHEIVNWERQTPVETVDEIEPQLSLFFLLLEKLDSWEHTKRQMFKDALVKKFTEYRRDLPELVDQAQKLLLVRDYEEWSIMVLEAAYEVCKLEGFNQFDVACLLSATGRLDKWISKHLAGFHDAGEVVRLVNRCSGSYTPVLAAVQSGSLSTLELLIGAGANSNGANEEGDTALMRVAHTGNIPILEFLLTQGPKEALNARNKVGLNALYFAIENGMTDSACMLLAAGASIEDISGQEPFLLMAIKRTSPGIVQLLLKAGIDPNAHYCGMSMLSWAIMHFRNGEPSHTILFEHNVERQRRAKEVIRLILSDSRTNVNLVEEKGATALALARTNLLHDITRMLLDRGAVE